MMVRRRHPKKEVPAHVKQIAAFDFSLVIDGIDLTDNDDVDALFEAGCDDATFGQIDGISYAEFTREAPTFADAVLSAIRDIEKLPEARVTRLEPEDLVSMSEIAERMDRSRESIRLLIAGERGPGGFPAPATHLRARTRLWRWSEVQRWSEAMGEDGLSAIDAAFTAALNDALGLRSHLQDLAGRQRAAIRRLISA